MIIYLIIIGAAAGFLATRLMRVEADVLTTVAVGILGALLGAGILRLLIWGLGIAAGFVGAFLGAIALILVWKIYFK